MHYFFVDKHNTPNLKLYTYLIFMAYFFTGVNFIIAAFSSRVGDITILRAFGVMGALFIVLAPIAVLDKRRENRGLLAVIGSAAMHSTCTILCSVILDFTEGLVLYLVETIIYLLCILSIKIKRKV